MLKKKNTLAKVTAYVDKTDKQQAPIEFEVECQEIGVFVKPVGIKKEGGDMERHTALHNSTGMVHPSAGAQLLFQIATCENPKGEVNCKAALEKASCMMMELQPQDAFEGLLISQMVAAQNQAMDCLKWAGKAKFIDHREMHFRFADRFMRTFTAQMETLAKYRRGGQQKVTVEHVHVHEGGQAIVGNVENHGGGGGNDSKK